jgi:hypothetical protein
MVVLDRGRAVVAVLCVLISSPAHAVLPPEIQAAFTEITSDAGLMIGFGVGLAVIIIGGFFALRFMKRVTAVSS